MEIVPAILDLVDNLNSPTVNKNKKGKHCFGIGYREQFPFSSVTVRVTNVVADHGSEFSG